MEPTDAGCTDLSATETIVFFPSFGHLENDGQEWKLAIAGVILEPGQVRFANRILIKMFRRMLGVPQETLESEIFQQRIRDFAAVTERGKRVVIRIGGRRYSLKKKTKRNGQFAGSVHLTHDELHRLQQAGEIQNGWLRFEVVLPATDERSFGGQVLLVQNAGLSIISDIDDTIKQTNVLDRDSLLVNTFLKEFRPVDGMSELYRSWAETGATFHYVSSSPWQLFRPLAQLCDRDAFPAGSFHLRTFRLRDHMLRKLFQFRRHTKLTVIKSILHTFPDRQFVLVGDSGEKDPELYGAVARKFAGQVVAILIRQLPERELNDDRSAKAFRKLSPQLWRTFDSPNQLSGFLPINGAKAPLATSH